MGVLARTLSPARVDGLRMQPTEHHCCKSEHHCRKCSGWLNIRPCGHPTVHNVAATRNRRKCSLSARPIDDPRVP
ncbi:hypothetical protein VTO73DRAFT_6916 [Trametes versicolor]